MFLLDSSYWEVQKTKSKGKGVFAKKDILPGTVIGDYIGTVIYPKDETRFEKKHGFYTMYFHKNASIFPNPKDDGIHLINHACAPNCWMFTYKGHTLYFSIRKIFKGEEITISYLLGPQEDECSPCKDQCKCGSIICSQTMHMPEKRYSAWLKHDEKITKKSKYERVKMGNSLPPLSSYPTSITDDSVYTLLGSQDKKPVSYEDSVLPTQKELRKRIRETGKYIHLKKLQMTVMGISDGVVFSKPS